MILARSGRALPLSNGAFTLDRVDKYEVVRLRK